MSYTKQNFQPNAVLTAAQLNAMDNQIYDNAEDIGELKEDLTGFKDYVGYRNVWRNGSVGTGGVVTEGTPTSVITDLITPSVGSVSVPSGYKIRTIKFYKSGRYYSHGDYQTTPIVINQAFVDAYDCIIQIKREDSSNIVPSDIINKVSTDIPIIKINTKYDDNTEKIDRLQSKYYEGDVDVVAGVSATHYIDCEFKQGETISFGLKCGFYMAKAIAFYYVTKTGESKLLKSDAQAYHAYSITLTEDISRFGVYISKDNYTSSGQYTLYIRRLTDFGVKPHIIKVSPTRNNLYATISSITDADIYNPYQIVLSEGTYDLMQEFTTEMINSASYTNDGFVGLSLADGISIIGEGDRDKIIIKCELDTSIYSQTVRNLISPLNPKGNCNVENVTILGINTRYAVHDDFDYNRYSVQNYKNCKFIEQNSTGGSAFGCGTTSGLTINMENCICENGGAVFHTNTNLNKGSCVHLTNCEINNVYLGDSDSKVTCKAIFNNCKIKSIQHEIVGSHIQYYEISGCGTNDVVMNIENGIIYSVGDIITRIISNVTVGDVLDYSFTKTTNPDLAYAIVVGYKDGKAYLQKSGYVTSTTLGLSNLSDGDYLTVGSNSKVISGGTKSNAIAIVKSSGSKSYCKMTI